MRPTAHALSPSLCPHVPQLPASSQAEHLGILQKATLWEENRRALQKEMEEEFQAAKVKARETVAETEGPIMKEAMREQIRQWFIECRSVSRASGSPFIPSSPQHPLSCSCPFLQPFLSSPDWPFAPPPPPQLPPTLLALLV